MSANTLDALVWSNRLVNSILSSSLLRSSISEVRFTIKRQVIPKAVYIFAYVPIYLLWSGVDRDMDVNVLGITFALHETGNKDAFT